MGTKRGRGRGAFIDSVLSAVDGFYADVLGSLRAWSAAPPKLRPTHAEPPRGRRHRSRRAVSTDYSSQDDTEPADEGVEASDASPPPELGAPAHASTDDASGSASEPDAQPTPSYTRMSDRRLPAKRLAGTSLLLFALAGCSADDDDGDVQDPAPDEPETFTVTGTVHVDVVGGVDIKRNPDHCVANGSLTRRLLAQGAESVVITDPDGTEVALGEIQMGTAPIVTDKDGEQFYAIGVCNFPFTARDVPGSTGVFTASIPELDIEARFTEDDSGSVKLRLDP